jgi:hypothetical protein
LTKILLAALLILRVVTIDLGVDETVDFKAKLEELLVKANLTTEPSVSLLAEIKDVISTTI